MQAKRHLGDVSRLAACLLLVATVSSAQQQTVGLFLHDPRAQDGLTLFAPQRGTGTYLIDIEGRLVHSWASTARPGAAVYLRDDGRLLRTEVVGSTRFTAGGAGGRIKVLEWDGTVAWQFTHATASHLQHHDATTLPNGNVLFIAWELKTRAEAVAAGRNPSLLTAGELWPDSLIEVQPDGAGGATIVWEWHLFDHLIQDFDATKANYGVVGDHPELVDLNFTMPGGMAGAADWTHCNAVKHEPDLDQIVVSVHQTSEIWIIDHSTTTAEAASHSGGRSGRGGDLLYRWGNPRSWRQGTAADQELFVQHDIQWIAPGRPGEGNLLVFNNGVGRSGGSYSTVDELVPPLEPDGSYRLSPGTPYEPAGATWSYSASPPTALLAQNVSGAERQRNGNTLICDGPNGVFFEVTPAGDEVWRYVNPVVDAAVVTQGSAIPTGPGGRQNSVFKIRRYTADHPGLAGRDLTPGAPIEPYVLLRNADVVSLVPLAPSLAGLLTGTGVTSLVPARDTYATPFTSGATDSAACPGAPLVFYEINSDRYALSLTREGPCTVGVTW